MSWDSKTDYCGLAVANKLICKDSQQNRSGQYLEKPGKDGGIAATKSYGIVEAPTCQYTIAGAVTMGTVKLGAITTVDSKNYALESISIGTTGGSEPTFSATARQVEDGSISSSSNYFTVPSFDLDPDDIAQMVFDCATLTGSGCELIVANFEISCTVNPSNVNGYPHASDVVSGKIVATLTIGQYGDTEPTVTPKTGWEISSPLTCSDPDSDMPSFTVSLTKTLTKTDVSASSST